MTAVRLSLGLAALLVAGCSTLPASGPTTRQVLSRATDPTTASEGGIGITIVPITGSLLRAEGTGVLGEASSSYVGAGSLDGLPPPGSIDRIGAGDVLQVNIYEVGVTLFQNGSTELGGESFDPTAKAQSLRGVTVADSGGIVIPYVGTVPASGRTPEEVARTIQSRLKGLSQAPQVTVSVSRSAGNRVIVSGDVREPGVQPLTAARERLLDVIAEAGGPRGQRADSVVRLERGGQSAEIRLDTVSVGDVSDLILSPGDRVEVLERPRSFTVFGATARPGRFPFETSQLTLAEALGKAGGLSDTQADPAGVFLFRFVADPEAPNGERPVVYRLDLMQPASYLLAQRFPVDDKDVLYIANAAANQPAKLVGIINQLFSPLVTARAVTR